MEENSSVSEHILRMSGYHNHLTQLGVNLPDDSVIDRVLQSLPPSYKSFMMNYNMQGMEKTIPKLFAMLKAAEVEIKKEHQVLMVNKTTNFKKKGKGKKGNFKKNAKKVAAQVKKPKSGPKSETECFYCKGTGHWKRNCPKHLADRKDGKVNKGHIGVKRIKKLHSDGLLESLDACEPCLIGKMTKTPFSRTMERATDLLKIIHIDSILRGRIIGGGRPTRDDVTISTAAGESGQITQSRPGSGAENITSDQATHLENASANHEIIQTLQPAQDQPDNVPNTSDALQDGQLDQAQDMHGYQEYSSDSGSSAQSGEHSGSSSDGNGSARQEAIAYVQPPPSVQWPGETSGSGASGQEAEEEEEEWHVIDNPEAEAQQWRPEDLGGFARHNRLQEDALYGMYRAELRELLSRRSVSNLLSSGFRESLDQLVHSYAQRQEHDPPAPLNQDHDTILCVIAEEQECVWQEVDEAIHDLRDDMAVLQRGMASTHRLQQACMEMQVELQRSIRQEVASAMHRSLSLHGTVRWYDDGSQWELVRKGTCCICCDSQIDSLLYRCGHMCTCSKCARELLRGAGKCPLCRAPIVEVVRAYSII
uniref:Protein neuralized n=1 Tax=Aegilops tauschii TaxID=37682 RepID=M8C856_AEGTA